MCLAYLRALVAAPEPCFGLVRTVLGYVLLDNHGVRQMLLRLERRAPWGPPDFLSKVLHKSDRYKYYTEAELRRFSIGRCRPMSLGRMLRKHLPEGIVYINVDQANAPERVLKAVKTVQNARVTLFLHDTIPLDYPEYQTPDSVALFEQLLDRSRSYADTILTNSQVSKGDIFRHMSQQGKVPPIHAAHLGVEYDFFQTGNNAKPTRVPNPYFLCLGTIEPRKNHAFLLTLWEELMAEIGPSEMPHLVVCGRRGWMNEKVFTKLDNSPLRGRFLHEFNDLGDDEISTLIQGATGMLFPSFVEGFGLPPAESAAAGTPVICNDLPVMQEILGEYPVYVSVTDSYAWKRNIIDLVHQRGKQDPCNQDRRGIYKPPSWEAHFNVVLKVT